MFITYLLFLLFKFAFYGSHLALVGPYLLRFIFTDYFIDTFVHKFAYGWYTQQTNERLAALNKLKFSVWSSRGAGLVLALDGGLILLPGTYFISVFKFILIVNSVKKFLIFIETCTW